HLLLCVSGPRLAQNAKAGAALPTEPLLVSVTPITAADPHSLSTGRTVEQHIRNGDRHLLGQPSSLGVSAVGLQVLVNAVDAFHDNLVLIGQHAQHAPGDPFLGRAGVVSGDHFDHVVFANVHD